MKSFFACLVFDASVKSPVGVEYGVEYQFGNFDQCLEISTNPEIDKIDIQSKYCLVDVNLEGYKIRKTAERVKEVRTVIDTSYDVFK